MNEIKRQKKLSDQLLSSCKEGDIESARKLIEDGASVENGLLHIAAREGNLDLVKLLVEHGADILKEETDSGREYIPMFEAIENGHMNVVNFLRERHRQTNKPAINRWERTPLSIAIYENKLDLAESFLKEGDNPNGTISDQPSLDNVPLHLAAEIGDLEAVELLIKYKANIDIEYMSISGSGPTVLYIACEKRDLKKAKFFLDKGANPNIKDEKGRTPLHIVSKEGNIEWVTLLLQNQADPNIKDNKGRTPLHIASEKGNIELATLLLHKEADPNIKDNEGITPLHIVSEKGNIALFDLLLQNGGDPNIRDKNGDTCLHIASRFGHTNLVEHMLLKGNNVDPKNDNQNTPLYTALRQSKTEIVKLLLKFGANPNAVSLGGNTPLNVAARTYYNLEAIDALIESGADINIADDSKLLPLFFTRRNFNIYQPFVKQMTKLEAASLHVDEQNLQFRSDFIKSSQVRYNSYSQHFQKCEEEIKKLTKENKNLVDFLKAGNSEESGEIWVENENVRNAFNNPERLKEQYPEYANILINKANEVKKEIFLHNHKPLIDALSEHYGCDFNSMTLNGIAAFCNDKYFVIDDLKLPLTNIIDFSDVNAKHPVSLKVQTFAKTVEVSTIRIEKNENVGTSLTDINTENVGQEVGHEIPK